MKVLIFGAGGVGSVVGGFLARTGHEVSLLGRPWHVEAIRKNGQAIKGIWGDYRIKAFDLYTTIAEVENSGTSFDLIILTVKSFDTQEAVKQLAPLMKPHTMLLSLQNGLGNIEAILEKVSPEQFLAGRIIFGVETEPGVAKVTVNADSVYIGPGVEGSTPKLSAYQMAAILNTAKIPSQGVPDILPYIWSKVIYNCALNAICTIHEIPYGKILENDDTREMMKSIVRECYAVGTQKGVVLSPASAEEYIDLLVGKLIPRTAAHFPSMLQDVRRGKKIDIDSLNGAIVRLGRETKTPTLANESVIQSLVSLGVSA